MRGSLLLAAAAGLVALPAAALTILDDSRSIEATGVYSCGITSCTVGESGEVVHDGSPLFSAGIDSVGSYAWQYSTVLTDKIGGTGYNRGPIPVDIHQASGSSTLSVGFELTESTPFALFGSISAGPIFGFQNGMATSTLTLSDTGGDLFSYSVASTGTLDSLAFDESFVLGPGIYTLFAESTIGDDSYALESEWRFVFATPEPSTASLLGLGLLGLSIARKRLSRV